MNGTNSFRRMAGITAIVAGIIAWLSIVIGLMGVDYNFDTFSDTSALIAVAPEAIGLVRWSFLLNMFGYYLLLLPAAIWLWHWCADAAPLHGALYTLSGITYILLGAIGAAMLAAVWPLLVDAYAANPSDNLIEMGQIATGMAEGGLQGVLQNLAASVWFLGMGALLRAKKNGLGIFTMVLGGFLTINALGALLNIEMLSLLGLTANLLLAPAWAIWLGITLQRSG